MGLSLGHYGMGWISQETGESKIVSHSGIVPDFGAFMALVPEQKKGMVLLFNANHAMMKMTYDEVGMGVAQRLAGEPPAPSRFGAAPWAMRGLLLIPLLQIVGVAATLRLLRRWRRDPERRPSRGRMWGQHILLPLIPNLLVALTLIPMLSKMRGFLMLFMPDYSWIAMVCGSFAVVWSFLRTGLILRALRKASTSSPIGGGPSNARDTSPARMPTMPLISSRRSARRWVPVCRAVPRNGNGLR